MGKNIWFCVLGSVLLEKLKKLLIKMLNCFFRDKDFIGKVFKGYGY